jgi:hypothetical protein
MTNHVAELFARLHGTPELVSRLRAHGGPVFSSSFDVTGLARDAVGLANLAASELLAARRGQGAEPDDVEVGTIEACAAFRCEALYETVGWDKPPIWDPIAGDYRAKDRFIRLHTNYAWHREAALSVLGTSADREAVRAAVATWDAAALEAAVVERGGCAAAMYTRDEWLAHPHGQHAAKEPPVSLTLRELERERSPLPELPKNATAAFAGLRVLDLTRVLAGPVCTRFLAAHGASVLRLDPPGFEEVAAVVPETSAGKRCAFLSLATNEGRATFEALLRQADVLVHGLRPGALARHGFDDERLAELRPSLVVATVDAYGFSGPWRERRGFDSLVQMSVGIAADRTSEKPNPLPAQALDHGAGYVLAAAVGRALTERVLHGRVGSARASLVGLANHLYARTRQPLDGPAFVWPEGTLERAATAWGDVRRAPIPGRIGGRRAMLDRQAGPLGASEASFD